MFSRTQRAETRNRAKDELKKVINAIDRVRTWEKKWTTCKDSSVLVYKWVAVSGASTLSLSSKQPLIKTSLNDNEDSNADPSIENSVGADANSKTFGISNEDSNTGFLESNFDSDSNQTFDRINYKNGGESGEASTDFSSLRAEEKKEDESEEPSSKRSREDSS
uniref:B-cell CLL/lymphoma 7 protein family member A n=1 Tax=Rhabditophanes sp. KR3021 TaxID=114890 RepID=A0AC35TJ63_9BILA